MALLSRGRTDDTMKIYVCEAEDPIYLGTYEAGKSVDGVSTYTNANDLSFFRSKGFWYLGDLGEWPPKTHFRCVDGEGCNMEQDFPAVGENSAWSENKRFAVGAVPKFSVVPCVAAEDL